MQGQLLAVARTRAQTFWHHCESATHTSEPAVLREAAEFERAFESARNLVDRTRDRGIADVSLVGGVEENDRFMLARVIYPARELRARRHRARRIVRKTKVDDVDGLGGRLGHKSIFRAARQVGDAFVA